MPQVLVRELDKTTIEKLKKRAERQGRSLQTELKHILEQAAQEDMAEALRLAHRIREKLSGREHTNSVTLVAEDRGR